MRGEQVFRGKFYNQNQIELNVGTFVKGIYLVKIQANEGVEVKKLVID
jgi:hypothetical protein